MWRVIFKKNLLFPIALIVILFGFPRCTPLYETAGVKNYDIIDFTKYSEDGFKITTEEYRDSYESCGLINVEVVPAIRKLKNIPIDERDNYRSIYDDLGSEYYVEKIHIYDVLDNMVALAKGRGADCIMRLDLKMTDKSLTVGAKRYGIIASGFAIKRKISN